LNGQIIQNMVFVLSGAFFFFFFFFFCERSLIYMNETFNRNVFLFLQNINKL
jgi:hypothetical protein